MFSNVATRFHLVGLGAVFGKLKTCRHEGERHDAEPCRQTGSPFAEIRVANAVVVSQFRAAARECDAAGFENIPA